jgi:hypothetical protein
VSRILLILYNFYIGEEIQITGAIRDLYEYSTKDLLDIVNIELNDKGWIVKECFINNVYGDYTLLVTADPNYKPGIIERIKAWITMKLFL